MIDHRLEWIVQQELIKVLCDDYTGCKEAGDNDDFHRDRQRKTLNMSVTFLDGN